MKSIIGTTVWAIIGIVIIIFVGLWLGGFFGADTEPAISENEGRLYVSVTDATADISSVNEVEMEVEKVEVFSQAQGWTTVSTNSKTFALLELDASGRVELHDVSAVTAGVYEKIRVTLGDVVVDSETQGRAEAHLPSNVLTFDLSMRVDEGSDTSVTLDFIADQSLHTSAEGEYVFAPVVETEARSRASVSVGENNTVIVTGGSVDGQVTVGVDIDGTTRINFVLDTSAGLDVESSVLGETEFMLGGQAFLKSGSSDEKGGEDKSKEESDNENDESQDRNRIDAEVDVEAGAGVNI